MCKEEENSGPYICRRLMGRWPRPRWRHEGWGDLDEQGGDHLAVEDGSEISVLTL